MIEIIKNIINKLFNKKKVINPIKVSNFYIHQISIEQWNDIMDRKIDYINNRVEYPEYKEFVNRLKLKTGNSFSFPTLEQWDQIPKKIRNKLHSPINVGIINLYEREEYSIDENPAFKLLSVIGNGREAFELILLVNS